MTRFRTQDRNAVSMQKRQKTIDRLIETIDGNGEGGILYVPCGPVGLIAS